MKQNGFTLIETLVAIAIIMLAVAGPLVIAQKGISSAVYARDQITAAYLAQDAMEYVRFVRDNNLLRGSGPWLANLEVCHGPGKYCYIDTVGVSDNIKACPDAICSYSALKFNPATGSYNHTGTVSTPFKRKINIVDNGTDEAKVTVELKWSTSAFEQKFEITENIFNVTAQ